MKRMILCALSLILSLSGFAKDDNKQKIDVFYGVDFSKVVITGVAEQPEQFLKIFKGINDLLISEAKKYDIGKFINADISKTNLDKSLENISKLSPNDVSVNKSAESELDDSALAKIVDRYCTAGEKGTGLIIVADRFNKTDGIGTFIVVVFDMTSKDIISLKSISGKVGGFGLRNYWAGSLYNALRAYKK